MLEVNGSSWALGVDGGFHWMCYPHPKGLKQQGRKTGSGPIALQFSKASHFHKGGREYVVTVFAKSIRFKKKIRTKTRQTNRAPFCMQLLSDPLLT